MTETTEKPQSNTVEKWVAIVSVVLLATILGSAAYFLLREDPNLATCEETLKATLKAPATYRRVKVDGSGGPDGYYDIDYDANNSFNAPLRGHGTCYLSKRQAHWYEKPDTQ